jgi:hypothetical protein
VRTQTASKKTPLSLSLLSVLSPCLSRACLGKAIILKYKMAQTRCVFILFLPFRPIQSAAKNGIVEPFIYKNDHFAKTGSGQT